MNKSQTIQAKILRLNCYLMAEETKYYNNSSNIVNLPTINRYFLKSLEKSGSRAV